MGRVLFVMVVVFASVPILACLVRLLLVGWYEILDPTFWRRRL